MYVESSECLRFKIQEALFNVGLHEDLITLAHLGYFSTLWRAASVCGEQ